MPDYEEMYLIMVRATEKAIKILIEAQQKCEELYISEEAPVQPRARNAALGGAPQAAADLDREAARETERSGI